MSENNNLENIGMAVPVVAPEEKVCLTIEETAGVFGIGVNTLRKLIDESPEAKYILRIGTKVLIKRKLFEEYIYEESVL